jgi:transglutaminase-like putative cysteine protease
MVYSTALSATVDVALANTFGPYLYPNQYVNFDTTSLPISKAVELAYTANTDLEVVESVYNYMIDNFTYDYDKAATVVSGYLPVVNDVYKANTGICFDYAAVMATMLRSQRIPTRLEVGYIGEEYHAWISVYIEEIGWINGIIEFNGTKWNLLDPTFASTSKSPKEYVTKNSKYLTKYVY